MVLQVFHLPSEIAASRLLVGHFRLKRQLRKLGINRWPSRRLNSLDTLLSSVTEDSNLAAEAKQVRLCDTFSTTGAICVRAAVWWTGAQAFSSVMSEPVLIES